MPTTRKESLIFGGMMCFGMVLVMTMYNFYLHNAFASLTFTQGVLDLLLGFAVAFLLDCFLVGPYAKKAALKITGPTAKPLYKVLAISTCMVIGMASLMSVYGLITSSIADGIQWNSILGDYARTLGMNFIVALPLQMIVMGPVVRFIFRKYVKR